MDYQANFQWLMFKKPVMFIHSTHDLIIKTKKYKIMYISNTL